MTRLLLLVLALATGVTAVGANDLGSRFARQATTNGVISGRVLDGTTPVGRVLVTAELGDGSHPVQALTDDDGRYALANVRPGRYLVTASKAGWVATYYGSPRPGRPPGSRVAVTDGARLTLDIPIVRGGVIAGRIVDEAGSPMTRVWPWLLEERVVGSRRVIARATFQEVGSFERATDDRGEFRLFGLPPGTYYVVVTPSIAAGARLTTDSEVRWAAQPPAEAGTPPAQGAVAGYAPFFLPGTTDPAAAQAIVVGPGEVREGLVIRVGYVAVARITGRAVGPDGQPPAAASIELVPRESRALLESSRRLPTTGREGQFTFQNIAPGTYTLRVRARSTAAARPEPGAAPVPPRPPAPPPPPDLWGETEITVAGQDIENVTVTLRPASSVTGRLVFVPGATKPPADLSRVQLQFIATDALASAAVGGWSYVGSSDAVVQPDGTFTVSGLGPDRYTVAAQWPGMRTGDGLTGWWIANVRAGTRDLGDAPIDVAANATVPDVTITFSDRIGAIEGALTDSANRPAPEYFVLAFPVERSSWTTTSRKALAPVKPGTDGRFRIPGVLPGDYYLAVVTAVGQDEHADPAFLEAILPGAIKLSVAAGETRRQDLRIR